MEKKYSNPNQIDTANLIDYQLYADGWAYRLKLLRADGSDEVLFIKESDVKLIVDRMDNDNEWNDGNPS